MIDYVFSGGFWTTTLVAYRLLLIIYNIALHPLAKIPGPLAWSATRLPFHYALIKGSIIHDIQFLHEKYGPVLRIAPNEVTFAHPDAYTAILQHRSGLPQFLKDPVWWAQMPGHPPHLLSAIDPGKHAQIRRVLTLAFTPKALRAHEPYIQKYVNLLVQRLRELHSRYHYWISFLFEGVKAASFVMSTRYYPLLDFALMKCIPPSLRKIHEDHFQQVVDKVQRRLSWELQRPDVKSYVLDEDGNPKLPADELCANFMVLTTAGSETSATALTGTLNYLVQNSEYLLQLESEVRSAFASLDDITLDAVRDLPFLNAVLHEGLRLCPPLPWVLPRLVPEGGQEVCGAWLPGGTPVSIQPYTINRSPKFFHNPTTFAPQRWLKSATSDPSSPFYNDRRAAMKPFSVGPRACLGQDLAWAELWLILAKLVWNFEFGVVHGEEVKWEELRTFLLVERRAVNVQISLREGA
ncbi:hypothetical protein BDV06DRAFT_208597 [Aspergillus oleicola]